MQCICDTIGTLRCSICHVTIIAVLKPNLVKDVYSSHTDSSYNVKHTVAIM